VKGTVAVNIKLMPSRHPHEDVFEDYVFERLSETELSEFEEHLLICEKCQTTLVKTEDYIRLMKAATAVYAGDRKSGGAKDVGLRWNAAAAAILLLTCLTALMSWRTPVSDPKVVELAAYRGDGGVSAVATAPAGQPLDLRIDLKDVRPAAGYRVEIVDSIGRRVWFGGTPARLTKGLPPGSYWVRLATDTGEQVREFGLRTE
jgi:hypothetical protein